MKSVKIAKNNIFISKSGMGTIKIPFNTLEAGKSDTVTTAVDNLLDSLLQEIITEAKSKETKMEAKITRLKSKISSKKIVQEKKVKFTRIKKRVQSRLRKLKKEIVEMESSLPTGS